MWSLIPQKKIPPTRLVRYCCEVLKEQSGTNRFLTTGVRWAESKKRKEGRGIYESFARERGKKIILNNDNDDKRQLFESCRLRSKHICNPIIDWSDHDVWDYIRSEKIPVNPLYDMGFFRWAALAVPWPGDPGIGNLPFILPMRGHIKRRLKRCCLSVKWREKTILPEDGLTQKASLNGGWKIIRCRGNIKCCWMMRPMNYIIDAESIEGGERHQ